MAFIGPRRSRSLIACILGIGLALLFVWPSTHVWAQEPGGGPVNLDVILLLDNSMSMSHEDPVTGAPPSDPEALRIQAAKFLVDYLRANAETSRANHRAGVASFGGVVGDVASLRLLQDDAVREGIRAEEIQFTDFRGPLQFALREFRAKSFGTGNKMAVILLTDGHPYLTDAPMTEQELRAYFEGLAPLVGELQGGGVSLFVLGIGDAREDRDNWTRLIPQEHYIPITSTAELADVYHDIVADLIGVAVSKEQILPAEQAASIEVEPYLERIVFSFVKSDPAARISLTSPTGAVLRPMIEAADVHHSIYSVTNPDAGEWKAFWEGEGEVRYWVDRQYPLIRVEPIESASLVGRPITITASLVRNNMIIVDPGLRLEAEITLPDGGVVTQALSPIGSGSYTGSHEDVQAEGTYTVTAKAILDGRLLSVRPMPLVVEVFPRPILPTPTPWSTKTPIPQPTKTPMSGVVTPVPTPTTGLVELLRTGPILIPIVVGLGIVSWFLYRRRASSEREKELQRSLAKALDEVKKATSLGQIEEIVRPIEQAAQALEPCPPSLFAMKILKLHAIGDVEYAEQELKRYTGSEISAEKEGAGIAVFNLLIREEPHRILPRLYALMELGCDSEVLQCAQGADAQDVPDLKEADEHQEFDIRELCRIYSGLLSKDERRPPRLETEVEGLFECYGDKDLLALHTCIRDSRELRQGPDVIPIDVSPQLREGSFAGIPQLRPLRDVLIQFEGIRLHPLHTEDKGGFLDVLERAQQQLDGLEEEEERILPEWYMVARLFESWRDFIRRDLSEEKTKARLVVKPVTRWFPNNVGLGDVHVAWVLYNEGPSSAEIDHITLYLGERELECDAEGEVLLPGGQRRVAFRLSNLAGLELPADLDLELVVSVTDEWERRTERVCYPHHGFEVLKAFRGRVIGQEIVRLLQSNAHLASDELRQYCLEAKMCVHCNQLALLQLLGYSGGYPLFVHILLDGLIRYLKDEERWKTGQPRYVTCTDVPEVVGYIVGRDLMRFPGLIARVWTTFPSDERAVIGALLESTQRHGIESASLAQIQMCLGVEKPVAPIIARLEAKGMVEKKDERYKLRARLLEEWLQARRERDRASQSA